jgi:hypothetical protein
MIGELAAHGIVFVVMAFLFFTSYSFPVLNIGGNLGAGWWPRLVLGFGMICTVLSVVLARKKYMNTEEKQGKKSELSKKEVVSLGISSGIIILPLLLIRHIGFLGAVPLLLFGFMFQLGGRKPISLVLFPLLATTVFVFLFGRFMEVSLPRGLGIMRALSFYLY